MTSCPRPWTVAVVWLIGCGDPTFDIYVWIPSPYDAEVVSAEVEVFFVAGSDPFTCEDLAFDDVSAERQQAASLGTFRIGARAGEPGTVLRVGHKLLLARGFDTTGAAIVMGCSEIDDVDGTPVEIATVPRARVDVTTSTQLQQPLPSTLQLAVRDAKGFSIANRRARWRLVTPGPDTSGEAVSDDTGALVVSPATNKLAGPSQLDVHPMW